jgi:glycerophosphoryl diester phosphodiesterase
MKFTRVLRVSSNASSYNRRVPVAVRVFVASTIVVAATSGVVGQRAKQVIAHRGASGSAPEHTVAAYQRAIDQHADFVEPDLGVTKDNVLICLHDDTLERTTNVSELFPSRASNVQMRAGGLHWLAADFTLAETKRLDAGKWFDGRFAGQQVPTFQEMIDLVRGKAGLYPELKSPALYKSRHIDQVQLFVALIKTNGLNR